MQNNRGPSLQLTNLPITASPAMIKTTIVARVACGKVLQNNALFVGQLSGEKIH